MTSDPHPSSSDGQALPPRHRPSLDNLSKDTTEMDLWAFEDDLEPGANPSKSDAISASRSSGTDIPAPRERRVTKAREPDNPLEGSIPSNGGERIQMNVNKSRQRSQPSAPPEALARAESEFDDLEHWDDLPKGPQIDDLPPLQTQEPAADTPPEPSPREKRDEESPAMESASQSTPVIEPDEDEYSPVPHGDAKPLSLHPHLHLSKIERISLIGLLALLALGGLATVIYSLKRLPTESARERINHFPIKGDRVQVDSATSYWRAPITDGATPDTFRRGTKLLPVLELEFSGGNGAIRVLFRDDEHTVVGDAVTRVVRGAGTLVIPATAGFDDFGMHAAYRTGGSKPWTMEVFEAASETAPGEDFKRLFEMTISTDRR